MELRAKEKEGLMEASEPLMALYPTELERSRLIHFPQEHIVQVPESFHAA